MAKNRGKEFEQKVKTQFVNTVGGGTIDRLYDVQGGRAGVRNICDFIAYSYPFILYIECKSKKGNTYPLSDLLKVNYRVKGAPTQYSMLCEKIGLRGVIAGVLIWFRDHDKVVWVDIRGIKERLELGLKSVNIKEIGNYYTYELYSTTPRIYPLINFKSLLKIYKEAENGYKEW